MKIKEYVIKEIRKSYNEEELTDDQKKEIEVSAENIEKRLEAHNAGTGSAHTAKFRPVKLLYSEEFSTEQEAVERELQIKGWTRKKKELLINNKIEHKKVYTP